MTAAEVICKALIAGKSEEEIQSLLMDSHPKSKAAQSRKSCREQVAWYRSQLKRGHLFVSPQGELVRHQRETNIAHEEISGMEPLEAPSTEANCNLRVALPNVADATSLKSTFYQQLVEHFFIAELLQEAWFGYRRIVEILRAEVDASGYDVVFECDGILRYVQLKTSKHDAKRYFINVNTALAKKPGGCVLWLLREENPQTRRIKLSYLFFGGLPGEKLPALDGFQVGKHSKGDASGKKNERPSIRLIPKTKFTKIDSTCDLLDRLFGLTNPIDGRIISSAP
jgi:hypothetical protein